MIPGDLGIVISLYSKNILTIKYRLCLLTVLLSGPIACALTYHLTAAAAFISCRLDYCNSLLCGLPDTLLRKLQSVQNATARLITSTWRSDHISLVLRKLHWLPIRERVKFRVACLVRQSLSSWPLVGGVA